MHVHNAENRGGTILLGSEPKSIAQLHWFPPSKRWWMTLDQDHMNKLIFSAAEFFVAQ